MIRSPLNVASCQLESENSNPRAVYLDRHSKAREIVHVRLGSLASCEAMADLYSYIVYPDPSDAQRRHNFSIAMARWAVMERAHLENAWGEGHDMKPSLRPMIFAQSEKTFLGVYTRGAKILYQRLVLASMMLLPHVMENDDEFPPTVQNTALAVARKLGYEDGSQKTIEARVWAPVKPVVHVAAAAMFFVGSFDFMPAAWNDGRHPLCFTHPLLATMFYDDIARKILLTAELYRVQLPSCTRFRIREDETIKFVLDKAHACAA